MATYYIATTGSDSNTGAIGSPWASVEKFWASCTNADVLEIRGGTYSQANSVFKTATSGYTASNRVRNNVIMQNYAGETATMVRSSSGTLAAETVHLWHFYNQVGQLVRSNPSGGTLQFDYTGSYTDEIINPSGTGNGNMPRYSAVCFEGGSAGLVDGIAVLHAYGIGVALTGTDQTVRNSDIAHCGYAVQLSGATRPIVEDNNLHDSDRLMQNDTTSSTNDHGGEGLNITLGVTGAKVRRNIIHDNTGAGSYDYGRDGGGFSLYGGLATEQTEISYNTFYNNHGFFEPGTEGSWTNGNVWIHHNQVYGRCDYQAEGWGHPNGGSTAPTTPLILMRVGPDSLIEHNTFAREDGSTGDGGIRFVEQNYFAGDLYNIHIRDNVFFLRFAEHALRHNSIGYQSGFEWDYNMIWRNDAAYGSGANVIGGNVVTPRAYSAAGLSAWRSTDGFGAHDIWGVDPKFVNPAANNYTPDVGSPLIGAASDGTNIGAIQEVVPQTFTTAYDQFGRSGVLLGSTSNHGGAWNVTLSGPSSWATDSNVANCIIGTAATMNAANLPQTSMTDVYAYMEFKVSPLPSVDQVEFFLSARTDPTNPLFLGYAAHVQLFPTTMGANFNRISSTGVRTAVLSYAPISRLAPPVSDWYSLRFHCTGTNPTTLQLRIWPKSEAEPGTWDFETTDSTAANQVAGAPGVRFRVDSSSIGQPFTFGMDNVNFSDTPPAAPPPAPSGVRARGRRNVVR